MNPALPIAARFSADEPWHHAVGDFFADLVDRGPDGWPLIGTTDLVAYSAILLGVTCGVLGTFIVLRRQSLLGDAIGHSVLPGVCLGFLAAGTRSTPALLVGALAVGLLAAALMAALRRTTILKTGECLGAVFTGFYGLGIVLLKYIQNRPAPAGGGFNSGQAGLDRFLFGQIVGVSVTDVVYMAVIALVTVGLVIVLWRKLAVWSFDEGFAHSIGLPVRAIDFLVTALVTLAIVISIQAVGVVLVAAMLVTPAATAYLLTDRLHRMAVLAAVFGAAAGLMGAFFSLFGQDLPTGSFMVLAAGVLFALAFLLSPRHGLLPRLMRLWARRRRTQAENLLRSLYLLMEKRRGTPRAGDRRFGVHDVAAMRQESAAQVRRQSKLAAARGWLERGSPDPIVLTDDGLAEARRVVRNHRLWELFLMQEAKLDADHVHRDAEQIEHVLPPDVLKKLEQMLDHPTADPHGSPIPVVP